MTCELWVRGTAENGGRVFVDFLINGNWNASDPYPVLTQTTRTHPSGCLFYSGAGFEGTGWHTYPEFYTKGCEQPPPEKRCDCLNGGCVAATTYNTPGKYVNLADCQAGCAKDSICNGVCVPTAEIVALEQAAFAARSRLACK